MSETKTRSIIIEHHNGGATKVENIPENAKITFGPVQPGKPNFNQDHVLRIYTNQSNQLAVFKNVLSFRDLSLEISVREVSNHEEIEETRGPNGSKRHHVGQQEWNFVKADIF